MRRRQCLWRVPAVAVGLLLGGLGVVTIVAPLWAADAPTAEAIRQAEEARQRAQLPSPYSWGPRVLWWTGCPPGQPCQLPSYPAVPPPPPPYSNAPAPVVPPPPPPASPYPIRVNPAGRLLVLVNPVDAEVYLDGVRLQQQADLSYEVGLLAGFHQLEVKKDGYKAHSERVEILPGTGLYLPIALEK